MQQNVPEYRNRFIFLIGFYTNIAISINTQLSDRDEIFPEKPLSLTVFWV